MKKLYLLLTIIALLSAVPGAQAQTQQTIRVLGADEKTCLARPDIYRLQVPIIGCAPVDVKTDPFCCSDDGIYTIGVKGIPSFIATMVRFGIIVVITIMFLMLIIAGVQFQLSFGNTSSAYKALDRVKRAAMGLVVVLFSTMILYQVNPDLIKLNIATPEGIAQTVCCKIPGGPIIPTQLGDRASTSSLVSQSFNADYSVSAKYSGGETIIYTRNANNQKYCTWVVKDASGVTIDSKTQVRLALCPAEIKFPTNNPVQIWEVTPPPPVTGIVQIFKLDTNVNTCVYTNNYSLTKIQIGSIANCPDNTPIPDALPLQTWKEVFDFFASARSKATSQATNQSSTSFTYYVATKFDESTKKFSCDTGEVEPDANKCFAADLPEPNITGAGESGPGKNPTNVNLTRAQLLSALKALPSIKFDNPQGKDGLDSVTTNTLKALFVAYSTVPNLTINSLARTGDPTSPHFGGKSYDLKTIENTLSDADIEKLFNGLDVNVVTQFLYCKSDPAGDISCPTDFGGSKKCSSKWLRAWPRPFNAKQIDVACAHRNHIHVTTVAGPMTLNNQSLLAIGSGN